VKIEEMWMVGIWTSGDWRSLTELGWGPTKAISLIRKIKMKKGCIVERLKPWMSGRKHTKLNRPSQIVTKTIPKPKRAFSTVRAACKQMAW